MARYVMSLARGKTSDDVTIGTGQSSAFVAIDLDLASLATDAEIEMAVEQILIYRRKNLAASTTA